MYLQEIDIVKRAGPAQTIQLYSFRVVDPDSGTMTKDTETLWNFGPIERWVDVHNNDKTLYEMRYVPSGLEFTFKPGTKGDTLKLITPPAVVDAALGHPRRIITDVEVVEGDPKSIY